MTLGVQTAGGTNFTVFGVFWLTTPANNVQPSPVLHSQVPGISSADLALLRSGVITEQPFTSITFSTGTSQATIDTELQNEFTAAQNALNTLAAEAPATVAPRAFNGSTWAAYANNPPAIGSSNFYFNPVHTDYLVAASLGLVPGVTVGRSFGYVANTGVNYLPILATPYSPASPGVGAQRSISSTSALDTAAGTGARSVMITYLTTTFVVKTETVALNGTTAVNTVGTDLAYIESVAVVGAGSQLVNQGTITLFNAAAGAGGALASIAIGPKGVGDNQTFYAHHYVPAGKTCYIVNIAFGHTLVSGLGVLARTGNPSLTGLPTVDFGGQYGSPIGETPWHPFMNPIAVPGPDRILLISAPNTATANNISTGAFEYFQQ